MNPTVTTKGWWLFKQTIVEHGGGKTVFGSGAKITDTEGSLCVKEAGFFHPKSTCFLKGEDSDSQGSSLPDGKVVGRSKEIQIKTADGSCKTYKSSPFSLHSLVKQGDEVIVKKTGFFSEREVERIPASQVSTIISEDCNVCKALNPIYT